MTKITSSCVPPTLSNCYIPLPSKQSSKGNTSTTKILQTSKESDTRASFIYNSENVADHPAKNKRETRGLRRIHMEKAILTKSNGSSIVEFGQTKILCSVHGPRSPMSSSASGQQEFHSEGVLNVSVKFAPNFGVRPETVASVSVSEASSNAVDPRLAMTTLATSSSPEEVELSIRLQSAISAAVPLERLEKSVIDVNVLIIQSDGSDLAACVTAAILALADAGIELYDLVSCCSVAVVRKRNGACGSGSEKWVCLVDPTEEEKLASKGMVTLAMLPNWKEVSYWDQSGRISKEITQEAIELCRDGCATMHKFMRQCLIDSNND